MLIFILLIGCTLFQNKPEQNKENPQHGFDSNLYIWLFLSIRFIGLLIICQTKKNIFKIDDI